MHINLEKVLKSLLIFGSLYLLFEGFLYLSDVRLTDVGNTWPATAIAYSRFLEKILGVVLLFVAVNLFEISKDLSKYKIFVKISATGSLLLGGLLVFLIYSNNYLEIFKHSPSLFVWFPMYNQYVVLEAVLLISYSVLVYFWIKQKK